MSFELSVKPAFPYLVCVANLSITIFNDLTEIVFILTLLLNLKFLFYGPLKHVGRVHLQTLTVCHVREENLLFATSYLTEIRGRNYHHQNHV